MVARLRALRPDEVAVCTIVRAELLFGAARSRDPVNARSLVERFLEPFASLPFDDLGASHYAEVRSFESVAALAKAIYRFSKYWNDVTRRPFDWTYTGRVLRA